MERDLDIVELIKIIHGFRVMKKTLFTKDERILLNYQRANTIENQSSTSRTEDDFEHKEFLQYTSMPINDSKTTLNQRTSINNGYKENVRALLQRF